MRRLAIVLSSLVVVVVVGLAAAFVVRSRPAPATYWPTTAWRTATPEEQGMDSAKLAEALTAMRQRNLNIHSLLVIRSGAIVFDAYFYPYDGQTPHDLASVTKSVTTTLIGIAIDQGKLRLDDKALSFFSDRQIANRDPRKEQITVGQLASMSSGLQCIEANDEQTLREMMASPDFVQFTLDLPMAADPGTTYAYCSPGMHLLSAILAKATGMSELDFAKQYLFAPLGIHDLVWPADAQGVTHGWGDLHLYPRDAAKLGYLWLNHGMWDGKQVVSRGWVEDSIKVHSQMPAGGGEDYGYGWRIQRNSEMGEYRASGRGGQRIAVYPAVNALIVTTGEGLDPGAATDMLTPALVDPNKALPPNPAGVARLKETVASLPQPPAPTPVRPLPGIAATVSGKRFAFEPNALGVKTMQLEFAKGVDASLSLTFYDGRTLPATPIGLDGVYRMSPGDYGYPVGQRGYWADATTFVLERDAIANNDALLVSVRFEGDTVVVNAKERSHELGVELRGKAG